MPLVKVIGSNSSHSAAAAMAVTLAKASEPLKAVPAAQKKMRAERTRPKNPNALTLDQHVFPKKSIDRFTDKSGYVSLLNLRRNQERRVRPGNVIFCASRAWDERTETGFMKRIEDEFQQIMGLILDGTTETIGPDQKAAIDRMYALWHMRARYRELDAQEIQLNGIAGSDLTLEQEENLEKNGYMFARNSGTMPARQLNGLELQMRINAYARELGTAVTRWGVISAQAGEFIVPDIPLHGIIPVAPQLALVHSSPDGMILERNVAEINRVIREASQDYCFARDFASCPV